MLLFGHIGITIGAAQLIESKLGIRIDYRWIAFASLLPDMIDKPAGMILLPLDNGRVFGHTLLFLLVLLLAGSRYRGFLFLAFGSLFHLLEDEMWNEPVTVFWPLLGDFPAGEPITLYEYLERVLYEYVPSFSRVFISEVIGSIILVRFMWTRYVGRPEKA
jgi:membrane-bound metal-dependent hydrolase YbcI (DUF457 family)